MYKEEKGERKITRIENFRRNKERKKKKELNI